MAQYKYATQMEGEFAQAVGRDLSISAKHGVEVCRFIRGKNIQKAKQLLAEVIAGKKPIPYFRYHKDLGHKKGMAAGRFPKKTCEAVLSILESAEANAQFKGLNTSRLEIAHICAQKAARPLHFGRHRGRQMKRAHIEVVLEEGVKEEKKGKESKAKATKTEGVKK